MCYFVVVVLKGNRTIGEVDDRIQTQVNVVLSILLRQSEEIEKRLMTLTKTVLVVA